MSKLELSKDEIQEVASQLQNVADSLWSRTDNGYYSVDITEGENVDVKELLLSKNFASAALLDQFLIDTAAVGITEFQNYGSGQTAKAVLSCQLNDTSYAVRFSNAGTYEIRATCPLAVQAFNFWSENRAAIDLMSLTPLLSVGDVENISERQKTREKTVDGKKLLKILEYLTSNTAFRLSKYNILTDLSVLPNGQPANVDPGQILQRVDVVSVEDSLKIMFERTQELELPEPFQFFDANGKWTQDRLIHNPFELKSGSRPSPL